MTSARSKPGSGASIVSIKNVSHDLRSVEASSFLEVISRSMSGLRPSVPTMTACIGISLGSR
ncbi:MAG TPA: hypothetical protein VGA56_25685 [Opitutaceae bacterium]